MRSLTMVLESLGVNKLLLLQGGSPNPNIYYLLGVKTPEYSVLEITNDEINFYTNSLGENLARENLENFPVNVNVIKKFSSLRNRFSHDSDYFVDDKYVGCDFRRTVLGGKFSFRRSISKKFYELREVKTSVEVDKLRHARRKTLKIINDLNLDANYELDIKAQIYNKIYGGYLTPSFEPIVSNRINARFPHYYGKKIGFSDYLLIDMGVKYKQYSSDITRVIGNLGNYEVYYKNLMGATNEIADNIYTGLEIGNEFLKRVEKILSYWKIPKLPHSIGHGIGLEVHEFPRLSKYSRGVFLRENSVICIEPGIYEKTYGLRYEDMFIIGKNKAVRL